MPLFDLMNLWILKVIRWFYKEIEKWHWFWKGLIILLIVIIIGATLYMLGYSIYNRRFGDLKGPGYVLGIWLIIELIHWVAGQHKKDDFGD